MRAQDSGRSTLAGASGVHENCDMGPRRRLRLAGLILVILLAGTVIARRLGYKIGLDTVVRCRDDHLFTTIWIPGASVKSIRLGWWRLQWCPVGRHWSMVSPVKEAALSPEELEGARQFHDVRVP